MSKEIIEIYTIPIEDKNTPEVVIVFSDETAESIKVDFSGLWEKEVIG